MNNNEA